MLDIYIADPKALNWILGSNAYKYESSPASIRFIKNLLGNGLVAAQGDVHKRQRKAIGPAFVPNNLKLLTPAFFKCANKLLERLEADTGLEEKYEAQSGKVIDIQKYLDRTTLDGIGLGGFGYDYHALDSVSSSGSRLAEGIASCVKLQPANWLEKLMTSQAFLNTFPFLGDSPMISQNRSFASSRKETEKVAEEIIASKMQTVKENMAAEGMNKLSKDSQALKGESRSLTSSSSMDDKFES